MRRLKGNNSRARNNAAGLIGSWTTDPNDTDSLREYHQFQMRLPLLIMKAELRIAVALVRVRGDGLLDES